MLFCNMSDVAGWKTDDDDDDTTVDIISKTYVNRISAEREAAGTSGSLGMGGEDLM